MSLAAQIRNRIKQLPVGKTFGYEELRIMKEQYSSAAKTLERLQKEDLIKRVSKGLFYKPEKTVFGQLEPDYDELLRPYLFENGKRVAYETGTSLYNRLGLTRQMAFQTKIASRNKRIVVNKGPLKARSVKSYVDVTDSNYDMLGLLDAFKDVKLIPDCSVQQAIKRLHAIIKGLNEKQVDSLVKYALAYPSRAKALLGAILEKEGYKGAGLDTLKKSLNPLTKVKLGLKSSDLFTKDNWYII